MLLYLYQLRRTPRCEAPWREFHAKDNNFCTVLNELGVEYNGTNVTTFAGWKKMGKAKEVATKVATMTEKIDHFERLDSRRSHGRIGA